MGSKNKTSKPDKKQVTDSSQVPEDIGNRRGNSGKKDVVTDPRFSHVHYDPKFARARKQKTKVAIDSRFDRIFTDKNFSSSSAQVDKRGKPKKKDIENPLKHYYHLEDDEGRIKEVNEDLISQVEDDEANEESENESENDEAHKDSESESENESDIDELKKLKRKVQDIESEDEEEDDEDEDIDAESDRSSADTADTTDSDNEEDVYSMEHDNLEQEETVPEIDKETNRLGVVNLDWNHVRAVDIFMLFTSFLPKGGKMLSVSVYPSEFGLKRMEEEAVRGPVGLFDDDAEKDDDSEDDDDNDDDNDDEIDDNKLRAYELSRLRYYYAVVECDSVATADYLYKTCDGLEFERSSNRLDLRFIPDSMEFKHPPRDVATEAPSNYEGMDFHSKVLQLSKIELTWDEDEHQRSKSLKRKFNADQLADMELKEFLASDDSESESDDDNGDDDVMEHKPDKKRKKQELYRALLQSGGDSEDDNDDNKGDMEVTFNTGLEELSKKHLEKKNKESETVWEAYLRKKKEKKKTKKNRSDDESSGSDEEPRQEDADDFFVEEPTGKADKKQKKHKGAVDEAEAGRAELELLLANDDSEMQTGLKGYNMKAKKKSKGKKGNKNNSEEVEDDGKLPTAADYDDPRFSSLFTAPQFALDPTDPQFKRSAAYARQLAQKQGKSGREEKGAKQNKEVPEPTVVVATVEKDPVKLEATSKKKDKLELSSLVKSLKMKSQNFQMSSKNKLPSNGKTRK